MKKKQSLSIISGIVMGMVFIGQGVCTLIGARKA